jgi:hypothetical protein
MMTRAASMRPLFYVIFVTGLTFFRTFHILIILYVYFGILIPASL